MRVLICGSRDWDDPVAISVILSGLLAHSIAAFNEEMVVIDGGARGADKIAKEWYGGREDGVHGIHEHVHHETYPADWPPQGSPKYMFAIAGHERNQRMLDEGNPEIAFAFKNDLDPRLDKGGTEDMVKRCVKESVPVYNIRKVG